MIPYRSFILLATFLLSYNIFPNVHFLAKSDKYKFDYTVLDAERDCCNTSRKFNT